MAHSHREPDYVKFWGFVVLANYEDGSTGKPRYFLTDNVFEEYICKGTPPPAKNAGNTARNF